MNNSNNISNNESKINQKNKDYEKNQIERY